MQDSGEQTTGAVPLLMVVSGGQTGVDRAALDAAMDFGIDAGGWCPHGRRAADGVIPEKYPMTETHGKNYQTRTKWNVCDSDATLIICQGEPTGGTALTIQICKDIPKPYMVYQLDDEDPSAVLKWLKGYNVDLLNIAGPRELKSRPVYDRTHKFLGELFALMRQNDSAPDQSKDSNKALQVVIHTP
jgi:hypothetical protein